MKYIVKPSTLNINDYLDKGINTFLLPIDCYSSDYEVTFKLEEIKKFKGFDVFVVMNKVLMNEEIAEVKKTLLELDKLNVKGILFYDLAYIKLKEELNLNLELVWNQSYMVTNYKTCNFYYSKGVKYGLLSSEITFDEMIEIKNNTNMSLIINYFGYMSACNSKRKLISNYSEYNKLDNNYSLEIEEPVSKQKYHVFENEGGTSFKYKNIVNGFSLEEDVSCFDYLLLNEEGIDHGDFVNIVLSFEKDIINEKFGNYLGFFITKTIFKVKRENK